MLFFRVFFSSSEGQTLMLALTIYAMLHISTKAFGTVNSRFSLRDIMSEQNERPASMMTT